MLRPGGVPRVLTYNTSAGRIDSVDVHPRAGRPSTMSRSTAAEADLKLEAALAEHGARDPREFYRERLRDLKDTDPDAYERAVAYYRDTLLPSIANDEVEPLHAWTEYGRRLAVALAPGRTVRIDTTGRAHPYEGPVWSDLVLQIPDHGRSGRAVLIALPSALSRAQRATYDVLVSGKTRATG